MIAFLTNVAENVGEEARFMHQGMTSSDVLDTCLAVQLARASDILLADIDKLLAAIKKRALEHKIHANHWAQSRYSWRARHFWVENSHRPMPNLNAIANDWSLRARKSRLVRFQGQSVPSPI